MDIDLEELKKWWKTEGIKVFWEEYKKILLSLKEGEPSYLFIASLKEGTGKFSKGMQFYVTKEIGMDYEGICVWGPIHHYVKVPKNKCIENYLFLAKTKEDINKSLPKDSIISVKKELKKYYIGKWSSMYGSYDIKVPKNKCVKLDELG